MMDFEEILFLAVEYTVLLRGMGPMSVGVRTYLNDVMDELSYGALVTIHDCIWSELKKEIDEYGDTIYPKWLETVKKMESILDSKFKTE